MYYTCVYMYIVCVCHMGMCFQRLEEGIKSSRAEVTGNCKMPDIGPGNRSTL